MGEKVLEIPKRKLSYSGVFSVKDVWGLIFSHFLDCNYTPIGKIDEIKDFADEKIITKKFLFEREFTDNEFFDITAKAVFTVKKDVVVTHKKVKKTMQEGTFELSMYAVVNIDDDDRWNDSHHLKLLVHYVANYLVFKQRRKKVIQLGKRDMLAIEDALLSYFNAQNYTR